MNDAYFLAVNGQQTGPFSLAQVQEMWQAGMVSAQTLSWCKGEPDWQPLGQLLSAIGAVPPAAYPSGAVGAVAPYYPGAVMVGYPVVTSGLAITSFVLGLLSFLCYFTCLPGIVFGHIALSQIKRSGGLVGGRGFAVVGLVISYVFVGIFALIILFITAAALFDNGGHHRVSAATQDLARAKQIAEAIIRYEGDHDATTPPDFDALFPTYLEDRSVLGSRLGGDGQTPAYDYLLPGRKIDHFDPDQVLLKGRYATRDHRRVYVYADARAELKREP